MWDIIESPGPEELRKYLRALRESQQWHNFVDARVIIANDPLRRLDGDTGNGTGRKEVMSKMIEAAIEEMKAGFRKCIKYVQLFL